MDDLIQQHFLMLVFKLGSVLNASEPDDKLLLRNNICRELKQSFDTENITLQRLAHNPFTDTYRRVGFEFDVYMSKTMEVIFNPGGIHLKNLLVQDLDLILCPDNHIL